MFSVDFFIDFFFFCTLTELAYSEEPCLSVLEGIFFFFLYYVFETFLIFLCLLSQIPIN